MNIKRILDKNEKSIWYIVLTIVFILLAIKSLNSYYEKKEEIKKIQYNNDIQISNIPESSSTTDNNDDKMILYSTENKTMLKAIKSFVYYCNNKEIENAYKMLTEECKNAMFPTVEEFKKIYINNIFNIKRTYDLEKWSTDANKNTYLISLYENILETGKSDNYTQDYYTLIKNHEGIYRLNINGFIYGEERNKETTVKGITVKIENVEIYDEYEKATIVITNNSDKQICLTGNKYIENIYIQDINNVNYLSLNSLFDTENLLLDSKAVQTYIVYFNKIYSTTNKATDLILSDVILDYEEYTNSNNKENYSNRTRIKVKY